MKTITNVIFVHSLFRASSTYFYNVIKRTGKYRVYHEPLHEVMADLSKSWDEIIERESELKGTLRHGFLSGGYFEEYEGMLKDIKKRYEADFSYGAFFLGTGDAAPGLASYLDLLINGGEQQAVLQCTRTIGRIRWLKKKYDSKHVFLLRNPWDQWYSYKVDKYISMTPAVIYSQNKLPDILKKVIALCGFEPFHGENVNEILDKVASLTIPADQDYTLFFGLWLYAYFMALENCDVMIDMDAVGGSDDARNEAVGDLERIGMEGVTFSDCALHRTVFDSSELEFYEDIEERVLKLFRGTFGERRMFSDAKEYLGRERKKTFMRKALLKKDYLPIKQDAVRMRSIYLRLTNEAAAELAENRREMSELKSSLAEHGERLVHAEEVNSVNRKTIDTQDDLIKEQSAALSRLDELIGHKEDDISRLRHTVDEQRGDIEGLSQVNAGLNSKIGDLDSQRDELNRVVTDRDAVISSLHGIVNERDNTISLLMNSHSWRVTAPLRYLTEGIKRKRGGVPAQKSAVSVGSDELPSAFFTICSKNYLAYARVLHESIRNFYENAKFYVVLCDRLDGTIDVDNEPFEFVYLDELELPNQRAMAERYNITEFNTSVKPFAFLYLMLKKQHDTVVYLDPDILVMDRFEEVEGLLKSGAEAVLTPHVLDASGRAGVDDGKMLLFGIYNLGFIAARNTPGLIEFMRWWGRRLEHQCVIQLEKGLFVDQKWADLLPAYVDGARVLRHAGYNVAYWNIRQRKITRQGDRWFCNDQPLRFVHFSGNELDDSDVFSRHSPEIRTDSIGDLRQLLDLYRASVYRQGHDFYRGLTYAYGWNGAHGENLHTPKDYDKAAYSKNGTESAGHGIAANDQETIIRRTKRRAQTVISAVPVALTLSGSWRSLAFRAFKTYRMYGWKYFKNRVQELSSAAESKDFEVINAWESGENGSRGRILYIDWAIPKPDKDAASVTAVLLMKIMRELNWEVTFIPGNMSYESGYYEALCSEGIDVVCYPHAHSIADWLAQHAHRYDICVMARGPVVWPHLQTLKACAPKLRLIFNTVDLHYVREMRQAEIDGDEGKRQSAMAVRAQELDLVESSDVSIILSSNELYTVRKEIPAARLSMLPIVFEDMPGSRLAFSERRDLLFVGGFLHQPNVDAICYFVESVFPLVRERLPDIRLKVVGSNPNDKILKLADNEGIDVLGYVEDIADIFDRIRLSVAPLRYGAGIKGKIGTSMCYGVPCVATSVAIEGMGVRDGEEVVVGDSAEELARLICDVYTNKETWEHISARGYEFALNNYSVDAIKTRLRGLLETVQEGVPVMESLYELDGWSAWLQHKELMESEYEARLIREESLLPREEVDGFYTAGFCCVCGKETSFLTSSMYSTGITSDGRPMPNWREHMQCGHCGMVSRVRAALHVLHTIVSPGIDSRIYLTEQITPVYKYLSSRYKDVWGSEYLGNNHRSGDEVEGIRHEDIANLSFEDGMFSHVLSLDVLEHVPEPEKALMEVFRVLEKNGAFAFTVPFCAESREDIVRATLGDDGNVIHHLPAEYHGNPVDQESGSLCFRYFGWEILDKLRKVGFSRVRVLAYWSEQQGYLGREQYIILAHK